jgi:hypothetical protein
MGFGSTEFNKFNLHRPTLVALKKMTRGWLIPPPALAPTPRCSEAQVEEDSHLIGRHIHHSAFSLADTYFSQSDEK